MIASASERDGEAAGLKWRGDQPLADEARQRLIDAGLTLLAEGGEAQFTIGRIAKQAGVTRPTVYSYFEDRDTLLRETLLFAARAVQAQTARHLAELDDPRDIPVEAVMSTLEGFRKNPLLKKMLLPGSANPVMQSVCTHPDMITLQAESMKGLSSLMGWTATETREAAEMISRMTLSFLMAPEPRRTGVELRAFLERRLLPGLGFTSRDRTTANS